MVGCSFIYPYWTGTACCSMLTWAETKWARKQIVQGAIISIINTVITGISMGINQLWNAKVGSEKTWSNRQIWPWNMEWSRAKTNRVLPRKCTGLSKQPLPTTREKTLHMDITRWSTPKSDWLYSLQPKMEKLYTVKKNKIRSWLWLRSWTPYCQIQIKLKKVGKTARPFRYDLN